jgi:hypothetical protein
MWCAAVRFLTGVVKPKRMNKKNLEHTLIPKKKASSTNTNKNEEN